MHKLLSLDKFYFSDLEEKFNEANNRIRDLEIANSQVKKLNNQLQEENAGYTYIISFKILIY